LDAAESAGATVGDPYNTVFTYNGVDYIGQMTELYYDSKLAAAYFSPDADGGPFQTGIEYSVGNGEPGSNSSTDISDNTESGGPSFGDPTYYLGTGIATYTSPGGGGTGAGTLPPAVLSPGVDDVDDDDNATGGYDNTVYPVYQQSVPWPTISNVISKSNFVPYYTGANCLDLAKEQIAQLGYQISNYGDPGQTIQVYTEGSGVNLSNSKLAVSYLNYALSKSIPVIVGVDDAPGGQGNADQSTNHFIVIVGMGTDSNGNFYQFYDSSTADLWDGTSNNNKLYYNSTTGFITGNTDSAYDNIATQASSAGKLRSMHAYILTQVRKSKKK
jgi:hypothetical protein